MYALGQSYPLAFYVAEVLLHVTDQSLGSVEGDFHRVQLSQDPVSLIHTNPLMSVGYGVEYLPESVLPV